MLHIFLLTFDHYHHSGYDSKTQIKKYKKDFMNLEHFKRKGHIMFNSNAHSDKATSFSEQLREIWRHRTSSIWSLSLLLAIITITSRADSDTTIGLHEQLWEIWRHRPLPIWCLSSPVCSLSGSNLLGPTNQGEKWSCGTTHRNGCNLYQLFTGGRAFFQPHHLSRGDGVETGDGWSHRAGELCLFLISIFFFVILSYEYSYDDV